MPIQNLFKCVFVAVFVLGLAAACASSNTSESTGEYIDSAAITSKVKAAIIDDPTLSILEIDVETFKGRVLLSGFVETPAQKKRATRVANGVDGVEKVENQIVVK